MNISDLHKKQLDLFNSNKTKDISFRIAQLKKFRKLIKDHEKELYKAIFEVGVRNLCFRIGIDIS